MSSRLPIIFFSDGKKKENPEKFLEGSGESLEKIKKEKQNNSENKKVVNDVDGMGISDL